LGTRGSAYSAITAIAIGGSLGTIRRAGRIETIATISIRLRRITVRFYHMQGLLMRIRRDLTAFEDLCPEHVSVRVVKSFLFLIHNIVLRLRSYDVWCGDQQPKPPKGVV
jgi:hypothetical protein